MLMQKERELIVSYGKLMSSNGLSPGTSGNLSIFDRDTGLMAISPSGIGYFDTQTEDVVIMKLDGTIVDGTRKPSSEWGLHAAFYMKKADIGAIVHNHAIYCTTFAVLNEPIKAVHYVIGDAGADTIPCAPYRTFGTPGLAEAAVECCGESKAVLLANHGIVVCGADMDSAFSLARNLEYVAELQYRAMCIGKPNILTSAQMADAVKRFGTYGQGDSSKNGY